MSTTWEYLEAGDWNDAERAAAGLPPLDAQASIDAASAANAQAQAQAGAYTVTPGGTSPAGKVTNETKNVVIPAAQKSFFDTLFEFVGGQFVFVGGALIGAYLTRKAWVPAVEKAMDKVVG